VLAGRLKSADQQKIVFHDDLEATLTDGDPWYDEFKRQMDDYADKCDPPLSAEPVKPVCESCRSYAGAKSSIRLKWPCCSFCEHGELPLAVGSI
jgi:hypothetical protein